MEEKHITSYWLNPSCRFNVEDFEKHKNTQYDILELNDRYTRGDHELQDKLNEDIRIYTSG